RHIVNLDSKINIYRNGQGPDKAGAGSLSDGPRSRGDPRRFLAHTLLVCESRDAAVRAGRGTSSGKALPARRRRPPCGEKRYPQRPDQGRRSEPALGRPGAGFITHSDRWRADLLPRARRPGTGATGERGGCRGAALDGRSRRGGAAIYEIFRRIAPGKKGTSQAHGPTPADEAVAPARSAT